ncbi:MAG: dTDP-glucose 4,6-dehydratase [Simkaniaceae bacterium]|nr:dTDP-glucose 4,6-dehydratase [Candidatus Sacchlamyda saccharinae]
MRFKNIMVTGGAGFMGSAFTREATKNKFDTIVVYDLLTYAGNLENLKSVENKYHFVRGDINNGPLVEETIRKYQIEAIIHFAAESHVDTSIENPKLFYQTNVEGTLSLLEIVRRHPHIHFHQISTDEVYGSLEEGEFTENSPYRPNSPYAASKAAADHLVRSYAKTYGLLTTISHASNNFGPHQDREKFIPKMLSNCYAKKPLPVYGNGTNVRDWLFVEDHAAAIFAILEKGARGESYNVGARSQRSNIDLLRLLIEKVAKRNQESIKTYEDLITYVADRPGHDFRYALCADKLTHEVGWTPKRSFEEGIEKTVEWYA